jgi:uncharacterized repeat protein (TIGR01451 family)
MKVSRTNFVFAVAILALVFAGGSTASAQSLCNATVPDYSPDFSSNQSCLLLNGMNYAALSTEYPSFQSPIAPPPPNVSDVLRLTPAANYWAGSAWFQTPQPVASPFTTTFTFQLNPASGADGIAFVIQNSGPSALGPEGCGEGFAGDFSYPPGCTPVQGPQTGITNSIAIRFDSYSQGVGGNSQTNDPGVNNVTIQSCPGEAANSITAACQLAVYPFSQVAFADGNVHTATVTYLLNPTSSQTACTVNNTPGPCLDVILDGTDLFPTGVPFDMTTLGLTSGAAYVGFTGGTGGLDDNQDILSWIFTPQGETQTLQPGVPATYQFQNNAYSYSATTAATQPATTTTVTPIYATSSACNALVQETYKGAQCFVYTNLTPNPDSAVMFEVTCPNLPNDQCNPFSAVLGSNYTLSTNSGVNGYNPIDPFPGWLKGAGPDPTHPCTPPSTGPLFQSDQVISFSIDTTTKGASGGTGSCWVATYDQPDETLSGITITSPTNTVYAQNSMVTASYTCSNPTSSQPNITNNLPSGPVGPYLVAASCTQSSGTQSGPCTQSATGLACTGSVNTSTPGTQTFTVTATDSGLNQNTQTVTYTVVAPTNLQILNIGPGGPIGNGGDITYAIGVGDLGPANADGVIVTDLLPSNTKFVSGSGSNIACGIVNRKLSCSTTAIQCSASGNTVTCNVGTLAPLSISDLNGGVLTIKLQVIGEPTTTCTINRKAVPCTINTATVSAINTDTNSNPSSTVDTTW